MDGGVRWRGRRVAWAQAAEGGRERGGDARTDGRHHDTHIPFQPLALPPAPEALIHAAVVRGRVHVRVAEQRGDTLGLEPLLGIVSGRSSRVISMQSPCNHHALLM